MTKSKSPEITRENQNNGLIKNESVGSNLSGSNNTNPNHFNNSRHNNNSSDELEETTSTSSASMSASTSPPNDSNLSEHIMLNKKHQERQQFRLNHQQKKQQKIIHPSTLTCYNCNLPNTAIANNHLLENKLRNFLIQNPNRDRSISDLLGRRFASSC
jgi:hypothetical protein